MGRGRSAFTRAALPLTSVHTTDRECQRPATPRKIPPLPKLGQEEGPPASPEPGLRRLAQLFSRRDARRALGAGAGEEGREGKGAVLACRRGESAVGRVGRRLRGSPGCGGSGLRSHAAPAAGPRSPAPRARRWRRLARAREREAAPGMGGRSWPPRPLLCIIVTQAISCLEVGEK